MGRETVGVEVRPVRAPDGKPNVLLQLPDGYIVMDPEDARHIAKLLLLTADEVTSG